MGSVKVIVAVMLLVLSLAFLLYSLSLRSHVLSKVDTDEKVLYLTFDDGPGPYTKQVLNFLDQKQVPATFFVVGERVNNDPKLVRRMVDDGHSVGVHTYTHSFFQMNIKEEILLTSLAVESVTGKKPTLFRSPYGAMWPWVVSAARDANLQVVYWSLFPRDYATNSVDKIVSRTTKQFHPGAIIVLHPWNHSQSVKALPEIVSVARKQGYVFKVLE